MTELMIIKIMRESLMTVLIVSAPILGVGMFVGLIVSIIQTTTSIQEQTLTFVPKIVAIFITIILLGSWMIRVLVNYTNNIFLLIEKIGMG
ncbi:MAG TPA: flagellar biosynthesis protein FliQ [Spirochaetota bacterium]|nr:flagellar biosynthesis protein FliQ [Spirochaetota bacterium]